MEQSNSVEEKEIDLMLPNIYAAEATVIPVNSSGETSARGLGALGGLCF